MVFKPGPFVDSLCRHQPTSMDELRARAARYIQMEEHAEFRNTIRDGLTLKGEFSNREKQKHHFDQRSKRPRQTRGPWYDFYTPLNAPRVNILEEANHADLISLPPPAYNSANADKSKHYRYHRNHGHTTEECWSLKDKIEELIQAGHLGQYIQRVQASRGGFRGCGRGRENKPSANSADPQHGDKASTENNLHGIINTISGGFAGGESSNSARKRYLRNVHNINNPHNLDPKMNPSTPPIVFNDDDYADISLNQDDPMVISVEVANWEVQKTLIDQGSSADVLYWPTFLKLDIPHTMIQPYSEPLVGFAGERVHTRGFVELLTSFGTAQTSRRVLVKYLLVDAATSYNILIGRPTLNQLGAVVSTPHLTMKFPGTDGRIIAVKANQQITRQCYAQSLKIAPLKIAPTNQPEIGKKPNQCTKIGKHIDTEVQGKIMSILIENANLFAWSSADMPGIDPNFIFHKLAIHREAKPISQKQRKIGGERREAVKVETQKLFSAGFI
ncbi:uncharacterized protein LOC109793373 [Cajanus cajan]|uniref:uncharacterized protein LOC109793373 n=1 Tax=Cajanus cajan TaxID=3821 RepID=UPI00098DADA5|nr:uncharacterized protein LOC109793373 [Cajanus cajan]